jgi:alanine racemase
MRSLRRTATLIEIRVSRDALLHNYRFFKERTNLPVAPVLKSNAYGHGLVDVAQVLVSERPPLFVVDSYYEAKLLRSSGIRTPLLVIGYTPTEFIAKNRLRDVSFVVTSLEGLAALVATRARAHVHVKLDTGMRRQGLLPEETAQARELLAKSELSVEGICSHFASADTSPEFTRTQIAAWNSAVGVWRSTFPNLCYWHIAATFGSDYARECDANLLRIGSGIYGLRAPGTRPVLSLSSILTVVKDARPGDLVGYGGTFTVEHPMRLATVPVGYFEGVDRRLSSRGTFLVEGVLCPIVGRVSMNMTTIDVSNCLEPKLGVPVSIISDNPSDPNTLERWGELCDTTPLELAVHIPPHLRRVIV